MSLRGIANGDAVAISRKGNLVIKPKTINAILSAFTNFRTWSTPLFINTSLLKSNKRELIKISILFVCKLQSIFFIYQSQPLYISISNTLVFIFIKTHLLYMIARVSFWQFDKNHYIINNVTLPGDCHASLTMTEYFVRNDIVSA